MTTKIQTAAGSEAKIAIARLENDLARAHAEIAILAAEAKDTQAFRDEIADLKAKLADAEEDRNASAMAEQELATELEALNDAREDDHRDRDSLNHRLSAAWATIQKLRAENAELRGIPVANVAPPAEYAEESPASTIPIRPFTPAEAETSRGPGLADTPEVAAIAQKLLEEIAKHQAAPPKPRAPRKPRVRKTAPVVPSYAFHV